MMTDNDKNVRTLVVCFVVAIMALIPLRMVEAGKLVGSETRVLGEMEEVGDEDNQVIEEVVDENDEVVEQEEVPVEEEIEIVLPDAGIME